jgi:hypothetical protein
MKRPSAAARTAAMSLPAAEHASCSAPIFWVIKVSGMFLTASKGLAGPRRGGPRRT